MLKRTLCGTAAVAALAIPGIAHAQEEGASAVDTSNVIIVTATRRAEDIQDVPIAVTAVGAAELDRQGVVNVTEITQVSPSFSTSNAQNASSTNVLRIRGVGTTSNNIGFESAVGIFIDGAYQSRPGVALAEFVDVERVEILRGPQGTLFGRNTSAGALNITTNRPDLREFGGFANASYGNYDLMSIQGAVNVPLIQDTLAVRLTGAYRERDGYVDVIDGTGVIGESNDIDQYLVRGQIGYESLGGVSVRIITDFSESTANCCTAIELRPSPVETAGLFNLVGLGPRGGQFQPNSGLDALDDRITSATFPPMTDVEQWGITAEVEIPIGDNADLIYIGSYREFDALESNDSDFTAIDVFNIDRQRTNIDTMTHELRLQGEAFDDRWSWLVGFYYSDEDISQEVTASLGDDYGELVGALIFAPTGGAFGANPLTVISGGIDPSVVSASNRFTQNSESWSIFTHNVFELTDNINLTLGLRYSDESKDGAFQQTAINNPLCPAVLGNLGTVPAALQPTILVTGCFPFVAPADLPAAAVLPLPRSFAGSFSDEELIYTAKLSYEFDAPVTVYASFTHGYKSGGFNLDATAAIGGADPTFASEEVDAYEIGLKARALDDAVTANVALFYQEFSNFQVLEFTGAQFETFNVPQAISSGIEIETLIQPTDNLTFNLGVTWIDARYPGDCAGNLTVLRVQNLCGNELTNAPDLVAIAGADYRGTIGDNLAWFLNGQIRMEDDRRTSTQPSDPANLADTTPLPFDIQDGNVKINLRAGIGAEDESWGLEVWATNITNVTTRGVTFNTTLRSGSRSAFPQQPRMYGLTVRTRF
ncbi:TonB-dependent receptor [Parasphingopyxis algicola]|uniref:TonB-dependent receptor n=1 Tax=Parasphingopyxis algicola TaxID=2026624 RepID=UPI0015A37ECE|nr:TonB-dependent receptor [Parasphingopyxis algicola]QLC26336.1 TonB-dependent receptor [Parasphingopyxis algicola]